MGGRCAITQLPAAFGSCGVTCPSTSPPGLGTRGPTPASSGSDPVAGVPPDAFTAVRSALGQPHLRLGRPCGAEGYRWWTEPPRRSRDLFDSLRIDHFRAFVGLVGGAAGRPHRALPGSWRRGPGALEDDAAPAPGSARSRSWPRTWASSPPPVRASDGAGWGWPGSVVIQFAFERVSPGNAHSPREPRAATPWSTRGPTTTRRRAGWWETGLFEAMRAAGPRPPCAAAGIAGEPIPHRLVVAAPGAVVAGGPGDRAGPGPARPRLRGPPQHAGARHGKWTWRLRRGQSHTADHAGVAARGDRARRDAPDRRTPPTWVSSARRSRCGRPCPARSAPSGRTGTSPRSRSDEWPRPATWPFSCRKTVSQVVGAGHLGARRAPGVARC